MGEVDQLRQSIDEQVERENRRAEITMAVLLLFFVSVFGGLFAVAPRPIDYYADPKPIIGLLAVVFPVAILRLWLAWNGRIGKHLAHVFIVFDISVITFLIFSTHIRYHQSATFSLKGQLYIFYFIFIALRALLLDWTGVAKAGFWTLAAWSALVFYAMVQPDAQLTRSYTDYIYGPNILAGAEVEKLLVIGLFTAILAVAVARHRATLVATIVHLRDALRANEQRSHTAARQGNLAGQDLRDQLAAAQEKVDLMTSVAHELRTPMNGVIGMINAAKNAPEVERPEHLAVAMTAADQLLELINLILEFQYVESGELVDNRVDFRPLVEQRFAGYREQAPEGLEPQCRFEPAGRWSFGADEGKVLRVLDVLVRNAMQTSPDAAIEVTCRLDAEELCIIVEDQAVGAEARNRRTLIDRFARGEAHASAAFGATGLGLALATRLVTRMGGAFRTEARISGAQEAGARGAAARDLGTRFIVTLPVREPLLLDEVLPEARKDLPDFASCRVMVVEDNLINQKVLVNLLRRLGTQARLAKDGLEALTLWDDEAADLILMDIQMPNMDGNEATARIRERVASAGGDEPIIIAVTAHAHGDFLRECREKGFDDLIEKPVWLKTLVSTLKRYYAVEIAHTADEA